MKRRMYAIMAVALFVTACQQASIQNQTQALTLSQEALGIRQAQVRRFETTQEKVVLGAVLGVMQDLGFTVEETTSGFGLIAGTKDRRAVEADSDIGKNFFAALVSSLGGQNDIRWNATQKIKLSVTSQPTSDKTAIIIRATIQRIVHDSQQQVSQLETITDPQIYQQFFDKLAQSLFLEAHEI